MSETSVPLYSSIIQQYLQKPLTEVHLLDAGCRTGNYSKAFLENGVGKISSFDASKEMVSATHEKLAPYLTENRIGDIKCAELPKVPFPDASFDVVTLIRVLKHVGKPFENYCTAKESITEAFRVLKPGGVLMINYSTHDQLRYGAWFYDLLPRTIEKLCDLSIPQNELLSFLEGLTFENALSVVCPWQLSWTPQLYFNKDGPYDPAWRKLDSIWRFAQKEGEVESALKSLKEKKDFDMLDGWFELMEQKRKNLGQSTCIFVQKPC